MYTVVFAGATVYEGDSPAMAKMIATAFAHAYNVRGWSRASIKLDVKFGNTVKSKTGTLGHDAIAIVEDFFLHY